MRSLISVVSSLVLSDKGFDSLDVGGIGKLPNLSSVLRPLLFLPFSLHYF